MKAAIPENITSPNIAPCQRSTARSSQSACAPISTTAASRSQWMYTKAPRLFGVSSARGSRLSRAIVSHSPREPANPALTAPISISAALATSASCQIRATCGDPVRA